MIILVGLLFLLALPAAAKGPSDRIVLTGPALKGEMILTNPQVVMALSMGSLEDFIGGPLEEPAVKSAVYYDLERQWQESADRFETMDRVRYYPGDGNLPGYVFYLGLENGWTEYDSKWFRAQPEADVAFQTAFDPNAQPYLVLMQDNGHFRLADTVTLEDVADVEVFDYETSLADFVDGPDTGTLYVNTHDAGFAQHYRVNLFDGTACWAEVVPPSVERRSGALWVAGSVAQDLSRTMQGTWLEPIGLRTESTVLLYHPLGRYHNYNYGAEDRGEIPGGVLVYSPINNRQLAQWQPDLRFAQVIAGADVLYAIEAPRGEDRVDVYALDADSGEILNARTLDTGRWTLGYGILDLTTLETQTRLNFVDRCSYNRWEIPQGWRLDLQLAAAGS